MAETEEMVDKHQAKAPLRDKGAIQGVPKRKKGRATKYISISTQDRRIISNNEGQDL